MRSLLLRRFFLKNLVHRYYHFWTNHRRIGNTLFIVKILILRYFVWFWTNHHRIFNVLGVKIIFNVFILVQNHLLTLPKHLSNRYNTAIEHWKNWFSQVKSSLTQIGLSMLSNFQVGSLPKFGKGDFLEGMWGTSYPIMISRRKVTRGSNTCDRYFWDDFFLKILFLRNYEVVGVHKTIYRELRGFLTRFWHYCDFLIRFAIFIAPDANFVDAENWPYLQFRKGEK